MAVYAPGRISDGAHLASPDVPKALRIEVRYENDLRRHVLLDWWRELVPRLDAAAEANLQQSSLRYGTGTSY